MNDAGKIAFTPKGDYSSAVTYEYLDTVVYNGNAYAALKTTTGNAPEEGSEYWILLARGGTSVPVATEGTEGVVKASDDIGVDSDAKMVFRTNFTSQENLTELESGESRNTFFGKIAKAVSELISHINTSATAEKAGHVKLSDSSAVTDSTGLALPATEKNATIDGTLANQISELNTNLSSTVIIKSVKIYAATTIAAGQCADIYFSVPTVKGYKCILGIGGTSSNSYAIPIRASDVPKSDGTLRLFYKNISSGDTTVNDLHCNMIFVRY